MTNDELNAVANRVWIAYDGDDLPAARTLLRSIEISALREARELVEKNESNEYSSLEDLDRLIRNLELQ